MGSKIEKLIADIEALAAHGGVELRPEYRAMLDKYLAQTLPPPPLTYTRERPTADGEYWMRPPCRGFRIVALVLDGRVYGRRWRRGKPLCEFKGYEFAGPIPEPT